MTPLPLPTAGPLLNQRTPNWFERNWKWFVPVAVVCAFVAFSGFVVTVVYFIGTMFTSSYSYQYAVKRATESEAVSARIGTPLHIGWLVSGNENFSGPDGSSSLEIPVSGPKGHGHIVVAGKKHANRWTFETLEVDVDGEPPILLLEADPGTPHTSTPDST
jgi:hypothetical protein